MTETPELLIVVAIFALIAFAARTSRNRSSTLVLQKFSLSAAPLQSQTPTIEIVGRMQGVVAFILSLMGFSPITRFTVTGIDLRCETTSLSGQRSQFIPIRSVSTVSAGVHKPISSLVWAIVITVFGFYASFESRSWAPISIALVIAALLVVSYFLTKKFFIEVHATGGTPLSLLFTPNVVEGVPIDVKQALAVAAVIRDMVLGQLDDDHVTAAPQHLNATNNYYPSAVHSSNVFEGSETESREAADALYTEARSFVQSGQRELAVSALQDIVRRFPDTDAARKAQRALEKSGIHETT